MNLRSTTVLALVVATSLVACSSNGLRGLGSDAGSDAPTLDVAASDVATSGHDADPFNPCPAAPEPAGGTIPAGQACVTSQECVRAAGESVSCQASNQAEAQVKVQTCHRFSRAALGAPCAASRTATGALEVSIRVDNVTLPAQTGVCDARDGLTCDGLTQICAPFAAQGFDCTTRACISGTHCGPTRTCDAQVPAGQTCGVADELSGSSWCAAGLYCDLTEVVCKSKRPPGATCGLASECQSGACKGVCGTTAECIP